MTVRLVQTRNGLGSIERRPNKPVKCKRENLDKLKAWRITTWNTQSNGKTYVQVAHKTKHYCRTMEVV